MNTDPDKLLIRALLSPSAAFGITDRQIEYHLVVSKMWVGLPQDLQ